MFEFQDKFWKIISVAAVISIAYLAHGLHERGQVPALDGGMILTAESSEVIKVDNRLLVTSAENGEAIIFWELDDTSSGIPKVREMRKDRFRWQDAK